MHIGDQVLERVRTEGFAVVEGFLSPDELAAAREGLFEVFPTHEQYFAAPTGMPTSLPTSSPGCASARSRRGG